MSSAHLSALSLKLHAMIKNVTPQSFEAQAQFGDIRQILEAACQEGLIPLAEAEQLTRFIDAQLAVLAEAAAQGLGTGGWIRPPR